MKKVLSLLPIVFLFLQLDYGFAAKAELKDYAEEARFISVNLSQLDLIRGQIQIYKEWDKSNLEYLMKILFMNVLGMWLQVDEKTKRVVVSVSDFGNFIKYLDEMKREKSLWDNVKDFQIPSGIEKKIENLSVSKLTEFFKYYNDNAKRSTFDKKYIVFGTGSEYFTERVEAIYQRFLKTPEQIAAAEKEKTEKQLAPLKKGLEDLKQSLSNLNAKLGILDNKLGALKGKVGGHAK